MIDNDDIDVGDGFAFRIGGRRLTPYGMPFVRCLSTALVTLAEVPYLSFGQCSCCCVVVFVIVFAGVVIRHITTPLCHRQCRWKNLCLMAMMAMEMALVLLEGWRLLPTAGDFFAFLFVAWRIWRRCCPFSFPDAVVAVFVVLAVIVDPTIVIWCVCGVALSFTHTGVFAGHSVAPYG